MSHSIENRPSPPTRRPWRISLVITELDPGGAEGQFVRLATGLDRELFEPDVVCLSGRGALIEPLRAAGVPVTCLDARGRLDVGVVLRLRNHFRRSRPDLVQTFLFHANIAGRVSARFARVPIVVCGIRVAERRKWQLRLDRATDALVTRHVCVSGAVADYSARAGGLPREKLVVIPNAIDAARFAHAQPADLSEFGFPAVARVVLFVGRLEAQKDPLTLVEAFHSIAARQPEARLLIVGSGPLEGELRTRSDGLGDKVAIAGRRDDVERLLKASACLAVPSRWEGMPNVVLEAMAAGTPVVAADAEGVRELLRDGDLGSVVHKPGAEAFASAIVDVLEHGGLTQMKASLAQHEVREQHTTQRLIGCYQDLYSELFSKRPRSGPRGGVPAIPERAEEKG